MIADGVHVDPRVLELVAAPPGRPGRAGQRRVAPACAPTGVYGFAGGEITRDADGVVRDADGRLAGSGALLDDVLATWFGSTGASLDDAIAAATVRPAELVGLAPAGVVEIRDDGRVAP